MAITFDTEEEIKLPKTDLKQVKKWISEVIKNHQKKVGDIGYLFCSDDKILEVNKEYLQHDYYTDIITFDYCADNVIAGDMYISIDTVTSNAVQFETSVNEELLRVIIHGILHLIGFGDKTEEEEINMRKEENIALAIFSEKYCNKFVE